MTREDIYAELFGLVSGATLEGGAVAFVTSDRKLKHWSDVKAAERPALFQAQKRETLINSTGMPGKWLLHVDLYVYVSTKGAASPGEVLNPILDAIDAILAPHPARGAQTLGGLVQYARIEGTIETSEGTLGDDEVAIVPVQILTA